MKEHKNCGVGSWIQKLSDQVHIKNEIAKLVAITKVKKIARRITKKEDGPHLEEHTQKPFPKKLHKVIKDQVVSKSKMFSFLKLVSLKSVTDVFIMGAQDGVIESLYYRKTMLRQNREL